jgi:histidine triad (HIT) family protein
MSDCIFCRIVAGQAPCWKVYEDDRAMAFLDINPIADGHTLVIPKPHFVNVFDMPPDLLCHVTAVAQTLVLRYRQALGMGAVNMLHSAGRAARQDVFHYHLHIIPRRDDDGLHLGYRPRSGGRDFETVLKKIQGVSS